MLQSWKYTTFYTFKGFSRLFKVCCFLAIFTGLKPGNLKIAGHPVQCTFASGPVVQVLLHSLARRPARPKLQGFSQSSGSAVTIQHCHNPGCVCTLIYTHFRYAHHPAEYDETQEHTACLNTEGHQTPFHKPAVQRVMRNSQAYVSYLST